MHTYIFISCLLNIVVDMLNVCVVSLLVFLAGVNGLGWARSGFLNIVVDQAQARPGSGIRINFQARPWQPEPEPSFRWSGLWAGLAH